MGNCKQPLYKDDARGMLKTHNTSFTSVSYLFVIFVIMKKENGVLIRHQ